MEIHRWWENESQEEYWLEVTQRDDLGADLHAPQTNEADDEYWSYSLVREVKDGDVVFHYSQRDQAIALWSRAEGGWWEDEIYWAAQGTVGRVNDPYDRPGWVYGLRGPFRLGRPVTLAGLRSVETQLRTIRDELQTEFGDPLYFPFALSEKRELRTAQGYLFKLPTAVVNALPQLGVASAPPPPSGAQRSASLPSDLGAEYRRPDEDIAEAQRDPFAVDPAVIERGLRGHRATQNLLADHLRTVGVDPRSPSPSEPSYDLAWSSGSELWVAEIKSITKKNEERQLRLGLGQVLRYRDLIGKTGVEAKAVLLVERRPTDPAWSDLCRSVDVLLLWPGILAEHIR